LLEVKDMIMRIRSRMPRLGTRKVYFLIKAQLEDKGIKLGRDVLFNFLRAEGLLIKPKRSYIKTTNSKHWMKKYPNASLDLLVLKPEQLWVSDITYIRTVEGHNYLSLVTDVYSKKIMGYALEESLSTAGPLKALQMAIKNRRYDHELMHHSDRGLQYCSAEYVQTLVKNNIKVSMTQNGDPYENPIAERVNGILKYEFLLEGLQNHLQAMESIKSSIAIYNNDRPHISCNMMVPNKAHQQSFLLLKKWNKKPRIIKSEV